jgi:anaerobic magnesium-protoporphyrin IX monomethyl ester cyclase
VDSDDLAMLFQGTYETGFYRQVRELLHAEVRGTPDGAVRGNLDRKWAEMARAEVRHRSPRAIPVRRPRGVPEGA